MCPECMRSLPEADPPDFGYAHLSYRHPSVKRTLWKMKYRGVFAAARDFGEPLCDIALGILGDEIIGGEKTALVVPVPLFRLRRWKRGYNHADFLARALCDAAPAGVFSYAPLALAKVKPTKRQAEMRTKKERTANIRGSFRARRDIVEGRIVFLIDDIITTGATAREASRALKTAGAAEVYAIAVAH